ncbi:MAG: ABC transporter permease [Chloroflexi bacterium]|nr:MAG: ABC transporter permease [Chloroflexota bacterium]
MFKLIWLFFRVGAMNELQYRVNFFIQLIQSLIELGIGLIGLALVFGHTTTLAGWTRPELLAVMGVYTLMGGLINATIQPNMLQLLNDVQQGTLDYILTKPADSQLQISIRQVHIWSMTDLLLGLSVLIYAVIQIQARIGFLQALVFVALLFMGVLMIYCFWLILTTGAFWLIRMENILELFQGVYQAGRWPTTVYPNWLQVGLTFLVPVAFAVTVPAEAITGRLTVTTLLEALAFTIILLLFSRWFWKRGLRHYSGASA